jgi:cytochrome c biogenesis protein CcmG/thiol:disulfide interchange protein DsbE
MRKRGLCFFLFIVAVGAAAGLSGCAKSDGAPKVLANEPDVTFQDLQGKNLTLASLKGKVVVVNFWATWCDPCRVEIPWLIRLQQTYVSKGFTMVGVAMDEDGKSVVDPFVQSTHFDVGGQQMTMNYPIVLGNDDIANKFGGMLGFPTSIVISRDGKIAKRYIGIVNEADLEKQIKDLL